MGASSSQRRRAGFDGLERVLEEADILLEACASVDDANAEAEPGAAKEAKAKPLTGLERAIRQADLVLEAKAQAAALGIKEETGLDRAMKQADAVLKVHKQGKDVKDAVMKGSMDGLKAILESKADVNQAYELGFTALHYAALDNQLEIARMLVSIGADVKAEAAPEVNRLTPGAIAEMQGNREVADTILSAAEGPLASNPVTVHIYDVGGSTQTVNKFFRPFGTGAFHAGVQVGRWEYSFGFTPPEVPCGIFACPPRGCTMHRFRESLPMGATKVTEEELTVILQELAPDWHGQSYSLLRHNCCHFCQALCQRLGVGPMPKWVTNLAAAGATLDHGIRTAASAAQRGDIIAAATAGKINPKFIFSGPSPGQKQRLAKLAKKWNPVDTARMSADYNKRQLRDLLDRLRK